MLPYAAEIEVLILTRVFIYNHTLCMQAANAQVYADSPEHSLLDNAKSTKIPCADSYILMKEKLQIIMFQSMEAYILTQTKCCLNQLTNIETSTPLSAWNTRRQPQTPSSSPRRTHFSSNTGTMDTDRTRGRTEISTAMYCRTNCQRSIRI